MSKNSSALRRNALSATELLAALEPAEQAELDVLLADLGPLSFRSFVDQAHPGYQWYRHCERLASVLEEVIAGTHRRLIVQMPPRHGKSITVTRLFSAYYLRRYPERWVGLTTYAADLSYVMSRAAKGYYQGRAQERALDIEAVKHWETPFGGGMWAAGVGGPITGKGFHLGIVDDPIKNAEDAASDVIRHKQQEWWDSTFYTRQEPGAAIVLIATRWHERDLIGYLLEKETDEPERWHIVDFPAVAGESHTYPESCTLEPDWRKAGAALCPERYAASQLAKIKARIGDYYFAALFQQHPRPREGGFFKRAWFDIVPTVPDHVRWVRGWDAGATEGAGDPTAGVKLGRGADGVFYVGNVQRAQLDPGNRDRLIKQTAVLDGKACHQVGEQEPGAAGKSAALAFVQLLAGYPASTVLASGDKMVRADPFASQCAIRNVKLVQGSWNALYLEELTSFPTGAHDDQVDASSVAFNWLMQQPRGTGTPVSMERPSLWR